MIQRKKSGKQRLLALRFADIPLPHSVVDCSAWEGEDNAWTRLFTVREWDLGALLVSVSGEQTHEGVVTYWVYVGGENQLTCEGLARLTDALADAGKLMASMR